MDDTPTADLPEAEIERRFAVALADIRRGGTGDIARCPPRDGIHGPDIVAVLRREGPLTIAALAHVLQRQPSLVWGHVCYLRKCRRVHVVRYVLSARRRMLAVYAAGAA